jgi:FAD/FMN-containing dehydrogenase
VEVKTELARVRQAMQAAGAEQVDERSDTDAGQAWAQQWHSGNFTIRLGIPNARLAEALPQLEAGLSGCSLAIDAAHGLIAASLIVNSPQDADRRLAALRAIAGPLEGYVVMERGPRAWLRRIEAWGAPRSATQIMHKLKATWDPADILNPGEFPAHIR